MMSNSEGIRARTQHFVSDDGRPSRLPGYAVRALRCFGRHENYLIPTNRSA